MATHVNMTIDRPPMILMVVREYKSTDAENPIRRYWKPFVVTAKVPNHKNGHFVRPNRVALKYPNFKKYVHPDVYVRVFNFVMKANVKTFKEYIINAFSYALRDLSSNWCYNYMLEFHDCTFWSLHRHFANVIERFKMMSKYTWS
jgi:hypothetical protein